LMNNNSVNSLYHRYIKSYVVVFKGTKEVRYICLSNLIYYIFLLLGSIFKRKSTMEKSKSC